MTKQNITKILILFAITAVVAGIWFYKQSEKEASMLTVEVLHPDFELYTSSFDKDAMLVHKLPMIVVFGAETCAACRAYKPALAKLNAELQGKAIVRFIDISENRSATQGFPIQVIPTTFFYNADGMPFVPTEELGIDFEYHDQCPEGCTGLTSHQGRLKSEQLNVIAKQMGVM